jgi:hypothetical protein
MALFNKMLTFVGKKWHISRKVLRPLGIFTNPPLKIFLNPYTLPPRFLARLMYGGEAIVSCRIRCMVVFKFS